MQYFSKEGSKLAVPSQGPVVDPSFLVMPGMPGIFNDVVSKAVVPEVLQEIDGIDYRCRMIIQSSLQWAAFVFAF